jgi:hypothetical protein
MFPIVLAGLSGAVVFLVGLLTRRRKIIFAGAPAMVLLVIWFILASSRPDPQKEFNRLFGAENRSAASDIQTIKPTFMDGHFISFRMHSADFNARILPKFSNFGFTPPGNLLWHQSLPDGWPSAIETAATALHRRVENCDVYLLYFPDEETAYASILYEGW